MFQPKRRKKLIQHKSNTLKKLLGNMKKEQIKKSPTWDSKDIHVLQQGNLMQSKMENNLWQDHQHLKSYTSSSLHVHFNRLFSECFICYPAWVIHGTTASHRTMLIIANHWNSTFVHPPSKGDHQFLSRYHIIIKIHFRDAWNVVNFTQMNFILHKIICWIVKKNANILVIMPATDNHRKLENHSLIKCLASFLF